MFLLRALVLLGLVLTASGCITRKLVVEQARTPQHRNEITGRLEPTVGGKPGNPAYYALLPLTIPLDIVTGPFQSMGAMIKTFPAREIFLSPPSPPQPRYLVQP